MKTFRFVASALFVLAILAACGGGGSASPPAKTTVTGIASKGPIMNGTVNIYAVANGVKGALLATAQTDANGKYFADLGSYVGPIIAEAYGSYTDEATGQIMTIAAGSPLRAALALAQGAVSLSVTGITELAVVKAGNSLTADAITTSNNLVSDLFKVDIIATQPVAPTEAALANATLAQKDYTLALATVSQITLDNGTSIGSTLASLASGITAAGMTTTTAATFQAALNDFVVNPNNTTGIKDTISTSLVNAGTLSKSYTLALQGSVPAGRVYGIQFNLILPTGVTLNTNTASGAILDSSLALPSSVPSATLLSSKYSSGTASIAIVTTTGITPGAFATLTCNIPQGVAAPSATAFSVANLKVIDEKAIPITGVSVAVQ